MSHGKIDLVADFPAINGRYTLEGWEKDPFTGKIYLVVSDPRVDTCDEEDEHHAAWFARPVEDEPRQGWRFNLDGKFHLRGSHFAAVCHRTMPPGNIMAYATDDVVLRAPWDKIADYWKCGACVNNDW